MSARQPRGKVSRVRGGKRSAAVVSVALALALVGPMLTGGCGDDSLGPPESYVLLGPVDPPKQSAPGGYPVVQKLERADPAAQAIERQFADGYAAEMVQTVHLVKQLVRNGAPGGKRFPEAARTAAGEPLCLVVGPGGGAAQTRGLAFPHFLGQPRERASTVWLGLAPGIAEDPALVQTLSGRLAAHAAHWVASGGTLDPLPLPAQRLVDGYRMAMEVIAREVRIGRGPQGVLPSTAGSATQREVFAGVREGRFIFGQDHELRPAAELLGDPGVTAIVLYNLAQTMGRKVAAPAIYAPFVDGRLPAGLNGAEVLGAKRNFQAKLFTAWATAVLQERPPRDLADLIDAYGTLLPDERADAVRGFVFATYGGTLKAGGVSRRPQDATAALAELNALAADVVTGKRTLHDALAAPK
jgi:hypothetical protein